MDPTHRADSSYNRVMDLGSSVAKTFVVAGGVSAIFYGLSQTSWNVYPLLEDYAIKPIANFAYKESGAIVQKAAYGIHYITNNQTTNNAIPFIAFGIFAGAAYKGVRAFFKEANSVEALDVVARKKEIKTLVPGLVPLSKVIGEITTAKGPYDANKDNPDIKDRFIFGYSEKTLNSIDKGESHFAIPFSDKSFVIKGKKIADTSRNLSGLFLWTSFNVLGGLSTTGLLGTDSISGGIGHLASQSLTLSLKGLGNVAGLIADSPAFCTTFGNAGAVGSLAYGSYALYRSTKFKWVNSPKENSFVADAIKLSAAVTMLGISIVLGHSMLTGKTPIPDIQNRGRYS